MTSMLALNCQKKSGHTRFYGVGVCVLFCFVLRQILVQVQHSILLMSRVRLCAVGTHAFR